MKFLASTLTFVAVSVASAVLLALLGGGLGPLIAAFAVLIGAVLGYLAWRQTRSGEKGNRSVFWDWVMGGIFILVSLRAFFWLIYNDDGDIKILSPYNLGDISLHVQFIRYFASGVTFWPESPILSGVPLIYPVGMDMFNAVLTVLGADVFRGLVWAGLLGSGLTLVALWRWGRAFAIAAFLFNGGLAGFVLLQGVPLQDFQGEMEWKNVFLTMFVTQRGLLFAIPAGLCLLDSWRNEYFHSTRRLPFWVALVLYATMPLFNVHAFLFLSLILLAIFFAKKGARLKLVWFVGAAVIPATICVQLVTAGFAAQSGIHLMPGWMQKGNPVLFWVLNFGVSLPLAAVLVVMLARERDGEARVFVWTAAIIFFLCCFVSFAVWPWDNMKLMIWSWLVIAPYMWKKILLPLPIWPRGAICCLLFFSGAVSLIGGLDSRHGYVLASRKELADTAKLLRETRPGARFACEPTYNNPVMLLGHPVVCGYDGHLWSHGMDYEAKMDGLKRIFAGVPGWENEVRDLKADYLFVREMEKTPSAYPAGLYDLSTSPPKRLGLGDAP